MYIEDGIIKYVGPGSDFVVPGGVRVIDAANRLIIPGGIDPHTQYGSMHISLFCCRFNMFFSLIFQYAIAVWRFGCC